MFNAKKIILIPIISLMLLMILSLLGFVFSALFKPDKEVLTFFYFAVLSILIIVIQYYKLSQIFIFSYLAVFYASVIFLLKDLNTANLYCDETEKVFSLPFQITLNVLFLIILILAIMKNIMIKEPILFKLYPIFLGITHYIFFLEYGLLMDLLNPILSIIFT